MIISTLYKRSSSSRNGVKEALFSSLVVTTRDSYLISPSDLLALVLPRRPTYSALKPDKLL